MATWVTHLMISDIILSRFPQLDRRGFCVGSIAPDCNVENADWTAFTPAREVTHWMSGSRKTEADADRFWEEYARPRLIHTVSEEESAFLLGYYNHLLTDAADQLMLRDENRVRGIWKRLKDDPVLREKAGDLPETFDSFKRIMPKADRLKEIQAVEAEYLRSNPDSGYLTELLPLKEFPDYLPFLPEGAIPRKIRVMGTIPQPGADLSRLIAIDREEYIQFVRDTAEHVAAKIHAQALR